MFLAGSSPDLAVAVPDPASHGSVQVTAPTAVEVAHVRVAPDVLHRDLPQARRDALLGIDALVETVVGVAAAFASLCGVNPIPASSGKTNRHRLNRGGHRQANAALHRIVVVRLRHDERTQAYMRRRTTEGMSKAEVIRCLKRYVAREVFSVLRNSALSHSTP